jgi:hypothetical protein
MTREQTLEKARAAKRYKADEQMVAELKTRGWVILRPAADGEWDQDRASATHWLRAQNHVSIKPKGARCFDGHTTGLTVCGHCGPDWCGHCGWAE